MNRTLSPTELRCYLSNLHPLDCRYDGRADAVRGQDSNLRPSGYEPDKLPLLHPASTPNSILTYPNRITACVLD